MHDDQLTVSLETARELVDDQFPQWRTLPMKAHAAQGTVNAIFRVGEEFTARFALRPMDIGAARRWLAAEATAAAELAGRTRFPTPRPIAVGEPGAGYPLPWSVQTWLPGSVATDDDPGESEPFAHDLAEFIHGVRAIPDLMTHGDLIPGNVLVCQGRLAGVIDVGGLGPADPARTLERLMADK